MRRVVGRQLVALERDFLDELAARHRRVAVDVGTGEGQGVLRRARREPDVLVIGVDAVAENMREASHRASRSRARGGVPNALFVVAAADELPGP
ncbi:MAG: class I SAM-dependent methyltransferase, partial [Chloroflexota bacterium]|nr:class I SAM-dependent methyltransferase [Chloroflexota bacterium]